MPRSLCRTITTETLKGYSKVKEVLYSLFLIVLISCFSCATKRIVVPEISEPPREGLLLTNPVILSLLDARTDKEKSQEILSSIKNGLTNVYGSSTEWAEYFERVPRGKVAVKIRLKANEANFETRLIPLTYVETSFSTTLSTVSTNWSTVVYAASTQQTTFSTSFIPQGYWVGTSWLELIWELRESQFSYCG